VFKANALVEASYRLSLYEQRIMLACIAQVRRDEPLTDQQLYTVTAQQIADMAGVSVDRAYQHIKVASERLFDRRVTLHEAPNGGGKPLVRLTRWVQEVVYMEAQGKVALRFSRAMVPYLSQLTEQFTGYALSDVAKMTSAHAIRLYELLAQWRGAGEREVSVGWLRDALQLEDRYPLMADLRRWVIEPAIAQINEHSPLAVVWEQRKTGRKVTHIHFKFAPKAKEKPAAVLAEKPQKPRKPKAETAGPQQVTGYRAFILAQLKMSAAEFSAAAKPGEDDKQAFERIKRERRGVTAD
jgi:plasmid replication initiation protein